MNALLILAAASAAMAYADQLRVTVYNHAHLKKRLIDGASSRLGQVLQQAGINSEIILGEASSPEGFQVVYGDVGPDRVTEAACRARRDIALELLAAPPQVPSRVLGLALPLAPSGLNVRVFVDRIADTAVDKGREFVSMLAYVMAHEIGHVLLRTQGHTRSGIMTGLWSTNEYRRMGYEQLFFTGEQARSMRAMLTGDRCTLRGKLCRCRHRCGKDCKT